MERYLNSFLLFVLLGVAGWIASSVVQLRDNTASLIAQMAELKTQVADINRRFDQYVPRTEAAAQSRVEQAKHDEIDRRIDQIERRQGVR